MLTALIMPEEPASIPAAPLARTAWRRRLLRLAIMPAGAYLAVCLIVWALQTSLIFPGAFSQGKPFAVVRPSPLHELIELKTRDGQRTFAAFGPAIDPLGRPVTDPASHPTIIHFYGNGEHLAHALGTMNWLRRCGANVLTVEYLGYGMAEGKPSEQGMYLAADAAYEYLLTRSDIDRRRIVPAGFSLGAAAALDLASRRPVAGVVCLSPFTSMPDMARQAFPWLPTSLLLSYRFDNREKIARVRQPILLAHGVDDDLVPFAMSQALSKSAGGPVTLVPIRSAGHNDLLDVGRRELETAIREFLARVQPAP